MKDLIKFASVGDWIVGVTSAVGVAAIIILGIIPAVVYW